MKQGIKDRAKQIRKGVVPEGYKETKVSIIPNDWSVKKFKNIAIKSTGKYCRSEEVEGHKCIELEHIESESGTINGFISSRNVKSTKNKFFESEILYGRLRPYLQKYYYADFPGVCSTEIWVLKARKGKVKSKFLYYLIQSNYFNYNANVSTGSSMPRADWSFVSNTDYSIPPINEQQKIADILSTWDRAIELKESLIKEKEEQKKGLMQKLFTLNNKRWQVKRLEEVLRLQGGFAFKSAQYQDAGIPVVRISNIQDDVNLENDVVYYNKIDIDRKFLVEKENLLIAMSGATTGKVAVYNHSKIAYLNQRVGKFIPNEDKLLNSYLIQLVKTEKFKRQLNTRMVAGAQPNISSADIESLTFQIPSLAEQHRIAKILSTADQEIDLLKQEVEQLKEQKKGLMQLLLTGIVRVEEVVTSG